MTLQRKTQEFRGFFLIFGFVFGRILQSTPDFYDFMFFTQKSFGNTNPFPLPSPPLHELEEGTDPPLQYVELQNNQQAKLQDFTLEIGYRGLNGMGTFRKRAKMFLSRVSFDTLESSMLRSGYVFFALNCANRTVLCSLDEWTPKAILVWSSKKTTRSPRNHANLAK